MLIFMHFDVSSNEGCSNTGKALTKPYYLIHPAPFALNFSLYLKIPVALNQRVLPDLVCFDLR